ncbi:MAG: hypothetical protein GY927_13380 [bacterium]|nr:hypothetical protein [bacterium]
MNKYITHNEFYEQFSDFADAILECLNKTISEKWRNFRDRVIDNFRVNLHNSFRVLK